MALFPETPSWHGMSKRDWSKRESHFSNSHLGWLKSVVFLEKRLSVTKSEGMSEFRPGFCLILAYEFQKIVLGVVPPVLKRTSGKPKKVKNPKTSLMRFMRFWVAAPIRSCCDNFLTHRNCTQNGLLTLNSITNLLKVKINSQF